LLFAREGAKIVITDINQESGDQAVKDIQAIGGEALFIRHDVSNEEDWKRVAKETIETFDKVDILFNNAGIYIIKPVAEIELEEWNRLMSINVTGVFLGMKHIMPLMAKQNKGSVINASSIAG
jgi:NAD(P)-dependent dehydrogenase (short-subunit alcohol dehydrogenase family)